MIYELRIYHAHPGKMEGICTRFAEHTLEIFKRHDIKVVNFWLDAEDKEILYYVCEFEDIDAKAAAWKSFGADPQWQSVKKESEKDGPLVMKIESYTCKTAEFFK